MEMKTTLELFEWGNVAGK